jgi:hypothetical protein
MNLRRKLSFPDLINWNKIREVRIIAKKASVGLAREGPIPF